LKKDPLRNNLSEGFRRIPRRCAGAGRCAASSVDDAAPLQGQDVTNADTGRRSMTKKVVAGWFVALCIMAIPLSSLAADSPYNLPWERFSVQAGVFFAGLNSQATIGTKGAGVQIDLESILGMDTQNTVFRIGTLYRFGETRRNRVDLAYFYFDRTATKTLGQDIVVDNSTISAGNTVESDFNFQVIKAAYSYSFFMDDRMDLAASIGLFVMPITFDVTSTTGPSRSGRLNFTVPLPVVGLRGDFAITPRWFLRTNIDFFYLEYQNYTGALIDTNVALDYNPWKNFGVGLGFDSFRANLEADGEDFPGVDFRGAFKLQYYGLQLYARYFF
jgi:hypothetical protein